MSDDTPILPEHTAEDFDAFWDQQAADGKHVGKTTTIMGETVTLPASIPLRFEMEAKRLRRSKKDRDVRLLVSILFGDEALEKWAAKGMDLHQFMVLLAWAPRVIVGDPVTLAEVDAEVRAADTDADPTSALRN